MIRVLLSRLVHAPAGGSAEAVLSYEGLSWGWAFLFFLLAAAAIWWLYRWAGQGLSRRQRLLLTSLRALLALFFLLLLVRPVLLLTLNDPVRERLLVLIDSSQSMQIKDHRSAVEDKIRAAIAAGQLPPATDLKATPPANSHDPSRVEVLQALAANQQMRLWPRLEEKADLSFYGFGREARPLGAMSGDDAAGLFHKLNFTDDVTALGDSLRQVLEENRGQPIAGILILTDGANNTGTPPEEIAEVAKDAGLPLFLYGVGITGPQDIVVREVTGPRGAFLKERAEFSVRVRASGFNSRTVKLQLKANGKKVDEREIKLDGASEAEYQLGYVPEEKGEAKIEAVIDPLEEESSPDNNSASTKVRVLDNQIKVLYIEGEPRWDYRYLLSTLERDRRLAVKCVLFDGDPELANESNSPFLKEFPKTRADLVENEIIVLGDADPKDLGPEHMKLINEWVGELGGGLIFLTGPKHNPFEYAGTPLEPLLPVELNRSLTSEGMAERSRRPLRLKLSPNGELSPLLRLSENTLENREIWNSLPGVRWFARVARARPTAQVYLTTAPDDPGEQPAPVIAQQQYGQGSVMYFGFDETYRWRSQIGEKYYARIWNQIIQNFSLERQLGASPKTQLKVARPEYLAGEKVVISGKLLGDDFVPLNEPSVPGTLTFTPPNGKDETSELRLLQSPDAPGEYSVEFTAKSAGQYRFSTIIDPKAVIKFEAIPPRLEMSATAMDASLLQTMADISGGKLLREENLNTLPELIASRSATIPAFKKIELFYSGWWMVVLMVLACAEWLFRRLWQLK
ncbi:MAG: hypothetical protein H0X40_00545 [Chthoniobacterales bacterium]|nr:hypothetical protein [Chthoniobacterales bacterium]